MIRSSMSIKRGLAKSKMDDIKVIKNVHKITLSHGATLGPSSCPDQEILNTLTASSKGGIHFGSQGPEASLELPQEVSNDPIRIPIRLKTIPYAQGGPARINREKLLPKRLDYILR